jgi:hypothetical protein
VVVSLRASYPRRLNSTWVARARNPSAAPVGGGLRRQPGVAMQLSMRRQREGEDRARAAVIGGPDAAAVSYSPWRTVSISGTGLSSHRTLASPLARIAASG